MSSYSVTAYLPGPRNTFTDYSIKERPTIHQSESSFHLDDCKRRTSRQRNKLDSLNRTCEDNLDTCKMWYKSARKYDFKDTHG